MLRQQQKKKNVLVFNATAVFTVALTSAAFFLSFLPDAINNKVILFEIMRSDFFAAEDALKERGEVNW